jgi:hypothetical protein
MSFFEHGVGLTNPWRGAEENAKPTASLWFVTPNASEHLFRRRSLIVDPSSFVHG